jgi:hypothetical protein
MPGSEDQVPTVATNARVPVLRRLLVDAANEIDIAIRHAQDDRVRLDEQVEELQRRRDRLDRITQLEDDMLVRLVDELGAVVPGGQDVR